MGQNHPIPTSYTDVGDATQTFVKDWACRITTAEIIDILQTEFGQVRVGVYDVEMVEQNPFDEYVWKLYRYRKYWQSLKQVHVVPADARTIDSVCTDRVFCFGTNLAVPGFADPRGVIFYKVVRPFHECELFVTECTVRAFFTRSAFRERFKQFLIPPLLDIVYDLWVDVSL